MPKYVVSTTLKDPEWTNTQVIDGDVAGEITRLKEAPGKDIVQYGFGAVSRLMLEHGLLDELRLWVHPLIVGAARPGDLLFGAAPGDRLRARRHDDRSSDGIVILSYQADKPLPRAA